MKIPVVCIPEKVMMEEFKGKVRFGKRKMILLIRKKKNLEKSWPTQISSPDLSL